MLPQPAHRRQLAVVDRLRVRRRLRRPTRRAVPIFDSQGYLIPVFVPGETLIENWLPVRGAELNVDNNSIYAQDHWSINNHWSADLGFRYERVRSEATGGIVGVDTDTVGAAARHRLRRAGRRQAHPPRDLRLVRGPVQRGADRRQQQRRQPEPAARRLRLARPDRAATSRRDSIRPTTSRCSASSRPTTSSSRPGLSSPIVEGVHGVVRRRPDERTRLLRGHLRPSRRRVRSSRTSSTSTTARPTWSSTASTSARSRTSSIGTPTSAWRQYDGMLFQGRYNITNRWTLNGHYTVQLKNDGNYEGEGTNSAGRHRPHRRLPGDLHRDSHFPEGRLDDFQRHKIRLWTIYNLGMGRFGDAALVGAVAHRFRHDLQLCSAGSDHHPDAERKAGRRRVSGCAGEPDGVLRRAWRRPVQGLPGVRTWQPPTTSRCSGTCGRTST